jgi:hypothetical protein
MKEIIKFLVFVLVFTNFATQLTSGYDYFGEKLLLMRRCGKTLKRDSDCPPSPGCVSALNQYNITCICVILSINDQSKISPYKLVHLAHKYDNTKVPPAGSKCGSKY